MLTFQSRATRGCKVHSCEEVVALFPCSPSILELLHCLRFHLKEIGGLAPKDHRVLNAC